MLVVASFIANTQGVTVVAFGMCANQLLMSCLVRRAVAGDVVVVAREAEAVLMAADERGHRERLVTARS